MKKNYYYIGAVIIFAVVMLFACSGGSGDGNAPVHVHDDSSTEQDNEEPTSTLAGIDSNNDGVWDYIEEWIDSQNYDENTRKAIIQYTKAQQDFILSYENETAAVEATLKVDKADDCLYSMYEIEEVWDMTNEILYSIILNTKERNRAYIISDSLLSGHVFTSTPYDERASMCE